jgi:hypothetical protein
MRPVSLSALRPAKPYASPSEIRTIKTTETIKTIKSTRTARTLLAALFFALAVFAPGPSGDLAPWGEGRALAIPVSEEFGGYTLTQDRLGPGIWYFQIFETTPERPLESPPPSMLVSPMLRDPQRLVSRDRTQPFSVTKRDGRPVLRITRES